MSAEVMNGEAVALAAAVDAKPEVVSVSCECCGLTEECTPAYVARVRERFNGRWVCGLCGEAVKDEICRAGRRISIEEALRRHRSFSESFRSAAAAAAVSPVQTADHLIEAMRQLLRRSLDSQRGMRSTPNSPRGKGADEEDGGGGAGASRSLMRSGSCFSALAQ